MMKKGKFYMLKDMENYRFEEKSDQKTYRKCRRLSSICLLSLRIYDDNHLLCTPVYEKEKKHSIKVRIDSRICWVKYGEFFVVHKDMIQDAGMFLYDSYGLVDRIYEHHKEWSEQRRIAIQKKKELEYTWDIVLRDAEWRRREETPRTKIDYSIPLYLVKNAAHPYGGGGCCPR